MIHAIKEVWMEYPMPKNVEGEYRIEVSNFGNVRSFSGRYPEGFNLKGSLQQGYPIIRTKLFKPRSREVLKKIEDFNLRINEVQEKVNELRKDKSNAENRKEIKNLIEERLSLINKRKNYTYKTDKKRTVNFHFLVHRAVAELFIENKTGGEMVIHKDFNKKNNHVTNLEWVSKDAAFARYGDIPYYKIKKFEEQLYGKKPPNRSFAKLTEKDVLYIKEKLSQGKTLKELAHKFNVSDMQIHRIKTGENWGDVKTVSELKKERQAT